MQKNKGNIGLPVVTVIRLIEEIYQIVQGLTLTPD